MAQAQPQHTSRQDKAKIDSIGFKWTIQNFSFYMMKEDDFCLESPRFSYTTEFGDTTQWLLHAYPNGDEKYISLFLLPSPFKASEEQVTVQFSILNVMGEKLYVEEKELGCGLNKLIKKAIILDKANGLLPHNELTICCDIQHSPNMSKKTLKKVPDCRITADLSSLFEKKLFTDVTLSAHGEEFKVHKSILAARSSVFEAMFLSDMKEKNQDVIEIVDISKNVLRAMLSFIYSGKAPGDESLLIDLLMAADKYDLQRLKIMCENKLCMKLNVKNACDLLIVADSCNASELKAIAMDFINKEISSVLTTEMRTILIQNHLALFHEIFDYHLQCDHKKK